MSGHAAPRLEELVWGGGTGVLEFTAAVQVKRAGWIPQALVLAALGIYKVKDAHDKIAKKMLLEAYT